jgi:hypothetical protein
MCIEVLSLLRIKTAEGLGVLTARAEGRMQQEAHR